MKIQQRTMVITGTEFKINRGMDIPPRKKHGKWTVLFQAMKTNESVTLPTQQNSNALAQAAYKLGGRIVTRKTDNGITCWKK